MRIAAGEFKAKCLRLMSDLKKYHEEIIVTKFGKPIAKMVPFESEAEKPIFGFLEGSLIIVGDIVKPIEEEWFANG